MRDAMRDLGGDPARINPLHPGRARDRPLGAGRRVRHAGSPSQRNAELEFERNRERYAFLRWGQGAFDDFKVVPPNTGIVPPGQPRVPRARGRGRATASRVPGHARRHRLAHDDGQRARRARLGRRRDRGRGGDARRGDLDARPAGRRLPAHAAGCPEGATATDLVLTVTQILRETGVVGKFVEYFGHGLAGLPLADRATIGNMSPEYGATCGFFPVDEETLKYLRLTGRERRADRARRGVLQGEPALARPRRAADVLAGRRARPRRRRAVARRAAAAAGPRAAARGEAVVPRGARRPSASTTATTHDEAVAETFPASDPTADAGARARPTPTPSREPCRSRRVAAEPRAGRRSSSTASVRARARRGRDRRDHVAARTRRTRPVMVGAGPAREEGGRARPARASPG